MIRRLYLFILLLSLLISCRPQPDVQSFTAPDNSWASLFRLYWEEMNRNYLFWDLDSPGKEWDDVYEHYMPLFEAIEGNVGDSEAADEEGYRLFYDISKNLSDGHYSFLLAGSDMHYVPFSIYKYRLLREEGRSDDEIIRALREKDDSLLESTDYSENALSILSTSFGVNIAAGSASVYSGPVEASGYLEDCYIFYVVSKGSDTPSLFFIGRTEDDILYITLSGFDLYPYLTSGSREIRTAAGAFLAEWKGRIQGYLSGRGEDIKGLVIDLRGNPGGYNIDINTLWGCLLDDDLYIMDYRSKDGMNRTDYGPWTKYIVHADPGTGRKFDRPVAVITNKATISNGEVSALLFMAMRDYSGSDVALFGGTTAGGLGTAFRDNNQLVVNENEDPYVFNGGQFAIGNAMIVTTQSREARYRDGRKFEGIGIEPDYTIERGQPSSPAAGRGDLRLDAAFAWIRGRS